MLLQPLLHGRKEVGFQQFGAPTEVWQCGSLLASGVGGQLGGLGGEGPQAQEPGTDQGVSP